MSLPPAPSADAPAVSPADAPTVSVVIPAYNRATTIRPAIESVLRQSWRDLEVIVVDDGSADGTPEVVRAIADPRLRLIETPRNMGASAARNLGIREARAPWIAFQDSDDEWLPLKLEKQMARLLAPGAEHVAAYCGMLVIGTPEGTGTGGETGNGGARPVVKYVPNPSVTPVEGDILRTLLAVSIVSTQTLVVRRDRMLEIGGFDESFRALIDRECLLRLAALGSIACVDEPLVLQRFSLNSITRDRSLRVAAKMRMAEKHAALFARHPGLFADFLYGIAHDHRRLGNLGEARRYIRQACRQDPGRLRNWRMRAWLALGAPLAPESRRGPEGSAAD